MYYCGDGDGGGGGGNGDNGGEVEHISPMVESGIHDKVFFHSQKTYSFTENKIFRGSTNIKNS